LPASATRRPIFGHTVLALATLVWACATESLDPDRELTHDSAPVPPAIPAALVSGSTAIPSARTGKAAPVSVRVVDADGRGVSGATVFWRVVSGGGALSSGEGRTGPDGAATTGWALGLRVDEPQVLEVTSPNLAPLTLYAAGGLQDSMVVQTDRVPLADTVGAELTHRVRLGLRWPTGLPVIGARVEFAVTEGGGAVSAASELTDSLGQAGVTWRLGDVAGFQRVVARVPGSPGPGLALRGGESAIDTLDGVLAVTFDAVALPGQPAAVRVLGDSIVLDALGAMATVRAAAFDRAGNGADASTIRWSSLAPDRVSISPEGEVRAVGDGTSWVVARIAASTDSLPVIVVRAPAAFRFAVPADTVNRLGDTLRIEAVAMDRLGSEIDTLRPTWRNLTPQRADLVSPGAVIPIAAGRIRLEASAGPVVDTVRFVVRQVVASIVPLRTRDTVALDSRTPLPMEVLDSNGFGVPSAVLNVQSADTAIIHADSGLLVQAAYPGTTRVTVSADGASSSVEVTVEGVLIEVDGQRRSTPGSLGLPRRIDITNGRVRMLWDPGQVCEKGAFLVDTRVDAAWYPATSRCWGDWLYVGSSVTTLPTEVNLIQVDSGAVQLQMRFGNHWFEPQLFGFPPSYQRQPYPFNRTVWLFPKDYGYFTEVVVEGTLLQPYPNVEHEVGFGGLWGPATVRTSEVNLNTDSLATTINYNWDYRVDAAEFLRAGDPLARTLVPLGPAPMITPVFTFGYGSVYAYNYGPTASYGAFLYAAPIGVAEPSRTVCQEAWARAPFQLPSVTQAQLDGCGPP
jgi:hypothetical protein